MNRRNFLVGTAALVTVALVAPMSAQAATEAPEAKKGGGRIDLREYDATDHDADLEFYSKLVGFKVVHATRPMTNAATGETTVMLRGKNGNWAWYYTLAPSPENMIPVEGDIACVPFTHRHTERENVRVLSGVVTAVIDGVTREYSTGEIASVPVGGHHLFYNTAREDMIAIVTFHRDDLDTPYAPNDCYLMCLYYWIACDLGYHNEEGLVDFAPIFKATRDLKRSRTYMDKFPKAATNFAYFAAGGPLTTY